jgi:hypothetical protein
VWAFHVLERIPAHEVIPALSAIRRILLPTGFALIRSPDIELVAEIILQHGLEHPVYTSPAGPITALDLLYGHESSIARGNLHMRPGA